MQLKDLFLNRWLYRTEQTVETLGSDYLAGNVAPPPSNAVASGNTVIDINTNAMTINGAQLAPSSIPQSAFNIANLGWVNTCVFSSTDADTVSWTSGTFTSADGIVYSISAGNTGNMSAITYIYLNINVSITQYQITTTQISVIGPGRVLVAVAQNQTVAATFNPVETTLITANNIFVNSLSAISANLGTITAGSININNNAFIGSDGYATFIGVATLNKKAYTNFENAGRFVNTTTAGSTIAPVYGNQGVTLTTTATASRYARILWFINNVYTNNPTFTFSITANALNVATGDSAAFFGLGDALVSDSGYTFTNRSFLGIYIRKSGGVTEVASSMNNGNADGGVGADFTTISDSDSLEIFIKVAATSVKWYYRKNGGNLALGDTQTTRIPTNATEQNVQFSITNMGTAADFSIILQCAAYEH
jgi:hypothetical protein